LHKHEAVSSINGQAPQLQYIWAMEKTPLNIVMVRGSQPLMRQPLSCLLSVVIFSEK
jgi:hypothetical protein